MPYRYPFFADLRLLVEEQFRKVPERLAEQRLRALFCGWSTSIVLPTVVNPRRVTLFASRECFLLPVKLFFSVSINSTWVALRFSLAAEGVFGSLRLFPEAELLWLRASGFWLSKL